MELALALLPIIFTIVKEGTLGFLEVKNILSKYEGKEATPQNIAAAKKELLEAARLTHAVDDPRIRQLLQDAGVDPEDLRVG